MGVMVAVVVVVVVMMMVMVMMVQHVSGRVGRDCEGGGGQAGDKRHGDEDLLEHRFGPWVLD